LGRNEDNVKYVYFFGGGMADGTGEMKDFLGGKGAGLHEMTRIGLPVPPGFTITTEACAYYSSAIASFLPNFPERLPRICESSSG
jgi:pyruvate,orthophosphate dikinase